MVANISMPLTSPEPASLAPPVTAHRGATGSRAAKPTKPAAVRMSSAGMPGALQTEADGLTETMFTGPARAAGKKTAPGPLPSCSEKVDYPARAGRQARAVRQLFKVGRCDLKNAHTMPQTAGRLSSGSAADIRHLDFLFLQPRGGVAADLGVAVVAAIPTADEGFENEFVAGALAQKPAQIHALTGKQAGVELAFGRQAGAGAGVAKRLRDGRDDADFATAVSVSPAARHFAEIVWLNRLDGPAGVDALENIRRRHHVIEPPAVGVAHVHEFDKTQHVAAAAKIFGHGFDAMIVHAALDHHVDLDRVKAGGGGVIDAGQHALDRKLDVVDGLKGVVVQRIEADGNALEPGPGQAPCLFGGKQRSVGGQADVVNAGNVGQQGNQVFQPVA